LIIRHPKEKRSKSSVIPSKIIAPNNVEILHTIEVPDSYITEDTVLMFPSDEAQEIVKMDEKDLKKIKKVILIDSTWSQTRYYLRQNCLKNIKHVKIQTEKTVFWRY
jgi:DTW domain-containing protein YfiP